MTSDPIFRRGQKATLDPLRAYAALAEEEVDASGRLVPTSVVFITNKECPFRCLMCDLWVNTLDERIAPGLIPRQIEAALASLPPARQVKLYNAGSFFDPDAIPPEDDAAIAARVRGFDRVIVESHPAFLTGAQGERCLRLRDMIGGALEVAIGLETAHPGVLARLNKGMTLDSFRRAAEFLDRNGIALRAFILLKPPFMGEEEGVEWACRSIDFAIDCGATACSIIPTRGGDQPRLPSLEQALEYGLSKADLKVRLYDRLATTNGADRTGTTNGDDRTGTANGRTPNRRRGGPSGPPYFRAFADLWDIDRFFDCACSPARAARLREMNRTQRVPSPVICSCGT